MSCSPAGFMPCCNDMLLRPACMGVGHAVDCPLNVFATACTQMAALGEDMDSQLTALRADKDATVSQVRLRPPPSELALPDLGYLVRRCFGVSQGLSDTQTGPERSPDL